MFRRLMLSSLRSHLVIPRQRFLSSVTLYTGEHTAKIKLLRRVSLFSSVMCGTGLPLLLATSQSSIDPIAQVVVATTALLTTGSSTLFLHICTRPYVVSLRELHRPDLDSSDRSFEAIRLNLVGAEESSVFKLSEVRRVSASSHPFASFTAQGKYFYVSGDSLLDKALRSALTGKP